MYCNIFNLLRWEDSDAQVVCRQLGYTGGIAHKYAHFGEGSGQIWLDNVECGGYESLLTSCTANSFGDENCSHGEDAGVTCGMCLGVPIMTVCADTNRHNQTQPAICMIHMKHTRVYVRNMNNIFTHVCVLYFRQQLLYR